MQIIYCRQHERWNTFVALAGGSFLQSWQWGEFKRRQGWHVLRLLAVRAGEPQAAMQILVRRLPLVGAFYYAPEGPVLPVQNWTDDVSPLARLLAAVCRHGLAHGTFALRIDPLTSAVNAPAQIRALGLLRSPLNVQPAATAVLDLAPAEDTLWQGLARDARYRIKRARRDGLVLRPGTEAEVEDFARMLADTGQRKGFGVCSPRYLRELIALLERWNSGAFLVTARGRDVVGATVVATFGVRAVSLYTASNAAGRAIGAQHLLHWEALLHAKRCGCAVYDFRGISSTTDPSDPWAGLSFFKQRFGTRREQLPGAWDDVYRPLAYRGFLLAQEIRRTRSSPLAHARGLVRRS